MSQREVWKRLLWKEVREDRWPLAIAFFSMTALYTLARIYMHPGSSVGQALVILAGGSVHLALAIWGATKGDSRRGSTEFEFTHLPTSPVLEWAASVGIPTIATVVLGLWFGFLVQYSTGHTATIPMPILGAVDLAVTYAVSYFAAALVSLWAGILVGMVQLMGGTLIPVWQAETASDTYTILFVFRTLVAALVGALILAWLYRKASQATQKGVALGAAVLIVYGPVVVTGTPSWLREIRMSRFEERAASYLEVPGTYRTPDGAIDIEDVRYPDAEVSLLQAQDHARGRTYRHEFNRNIEIISALRDGRVFLAQQKPQSGTIRIIVWHYLSNRVTVPAKFVTRRGALTARERYQSYAIKAVSPDGRYVLIAVGALIGNAGEVWAIDLKTGRSNVALLSPEYVISTAWTKDRALIGTTNGAYQIDLRTLQGRPFTIPKAQTRGVMSSPGFD